MSKIRTKKVVFFYDKYVNSTIMATHFIEILLVLEFQLTKFIVGTFSYKTHFRPQISSNAKTQLTTNPKRDLLKILKKQKHPKLMTQP